MCTYNDKYNNGLSGEILTEYFCPFCKLNHFGWLPDNIKDKVELNKMTEIEEFKARIEKLEARQEDGRDLERMDNHGKDIFTLKERIDKLESFTPDVLQDFEKRIPNTYAELSNRINILNEHKNIQIDENMKISKRIDDLEKKGEEWIKLFKKMNSDKLDETRDLKDRVSQIEIKLNPIKLSICIHGLIDHCDICDKTKVSNSTPTEDKTIKREEFQSFVNNILTRVNMIEDRLSPYSNNPHNDKLDEIRDLKQRLDQLERPLTEEEKQLARYILKDPVKENINIWTNIKDKLPNPDDWVLVYIPPEYSWEINDPKAHCIKIRYTYKNTPRNDPNSRWYKVTHWMPLPELPKDES